MSYQAHEVVTGRVVLFLSCPGLTRASSLAPPVKPGGDKTNAQWIKTLWAMADPFRTLDRKGEPVWIATTASRPRDDGKYRAHTCVSSTSDLPRRWRCCLLGALLAAWVSDAAAQDRAASPSPEDRPGTAIVEVTDGLLTLRADGAPLGEVLRAIGAAGAFEVVLRGGFATPVRTSFADRPLDDAIRELVTGHSVVIAYAAPSPESGAALARIRVIENPSAAGAGSAQPSVAEARPGDADDDAGSGASLCEDRRGAPPASGGDLLFVVGEPCPAVRATAPKAGSPASRAAIETASRAFANGDATARSRAVSVLTRLEGPAARRLLRERALADDHAGLRTQALNTLARSEGERAINVLAQALRQDPEAKVRINAIRALGRLGGDRARRTLERAARDLDPAIGAAAERALAVWPEPLD
jgi:HEAT repeats